MPRTPKDQKPPTALVASSQRVPGKAPRIYQPSQDWQAECYRQYAICGEARFAANFFGHALSRANLYAGQMGPDGVATATTDARAQAAMARLFGGKDGQKQMLQAIGIHFTIAGECYLVGREVTDEEGDSKDIWEIISCIEMKVSGGQWIIESKDGRPPIYLKEEDVVIRLWMPSPAYRMIADSPFKALLPILTEIEWLTRHIYAQVTSRLAGAGILMMPQGMTFPPAPAMDGKEQETTNDASAFMLTLADAMMAPIEDPSSPAALIPIVVTAPDEAIDKVKLLHFWSELDAASLELRSEAIRRFALGMDLPPEQVLGMSSNSGTGGGTSNGVSHWGAWQIEEATIKMFVEPMLDTVTNGLTFSYLQPETDDTYVVLFDTSALRLRPDRSKEAFELWDRGIITDEALLRENGFGVEDMRTDEEFRRFLLVKIASGSATPEQVQAALDQLGVHLQVEVVQGEVRESRPTPSLEEHPSPKAPPEAALLAACEALVFRALERAGNRLRQKTQPPPGIPSYETHLFVQANGSAATLMQDAWPTATFVLEGIADCEKIVPILDAYCLTLIGEQSPHSRVRLAEWLETR